MTVLVFWAAHVYAGAVARFAEDGEEHVGVLDAVTRSARHSLGQEVEGVCSRRDGDGVVRGGVRRAESVRALTLRPRRILPARTDRRGYNLAVTTLQDVL